MMGETQKDNPKLVLPKPMFDRNVVFRSFGWCRWWLRLSVGG